MSDPNPDPNQVPQPDEVRGSMAAVAASSHELKCGQRITLTLSLSLTLTLSLSLSLSLTQP